MTTTQAKKTATNRAPKPAPLDVVEHPNLAAALAAFQAEMPSVHKGKTARIPGKDGRQGYSYQYADLADVANAAHPVLARHGLSFTARPTHLDGMGFVLVGVLRHSSGETDEGYLPIQGRDAQAIGSSLTYNRRYLLGCMTGIVTDEDDDGARATQARTERPSSEYQRADYSEERPAQAATGTRTQGAAQEQPTAVDTAVVKALTIAATRATDLDALRAAWDQMNEARAFGEMTTDPRSEDGEAITLGAYMTARRAELEAAAVPAA